MATKPEFVVELRNERLWREGELVPTKKKVFDLLRLFVSNEDLLLTKQAILDAVWPGTHVSDASIKDCVKNLRIALGDDADDPRFIETVRGRGYRYLGGIAVSDYVDRDEVESPEPDRRPPSRFVPKRP
ncbi:MAG: winged helix-turn-helix domain-containing protein, partial [Planctomycetes bacterium]|nr:winged helix-turn-helix domain-containing protein [Planctomycetota bacterium]